MKNFLSIILRLAQYTLLVLSVLFVPIEVASFADVVTYISPLLPGSLILALPHHSSVIAGSSLLYDLPYALCSMLYALRFRLIALINNSIIDIIFFW